MDGGQEERQKEIARYPVVFPHRFGPRAPSERRASKPNAPRTDYDLEHEPGAGDRSEGLETTKGAVSERERTGKLAYSVPGGNMVGAVRFLVVPHGRGAETDGYEPCNHGDLMAPETRSLRLW